MVAAEMFARQMSVRIWMQTHFKHMLVFMSLENESHFTINKEYFMLHNQMVNVQMFLV